MVLQAQHLFALKARLRTIEMIETEWQTKLKGQVSSVNLDNGKFLLKSKNNKWKWKLVNLQIDTRNTWVVELRIGHRKLMDKKHDAAEYYAKGSKDPNSLRK